MNTAALEKYMESAIMAEAALEKVKFCQKMVEHSQANLRKLREELKLSFEEYKEKYGLREATPAKAELSWTEFHRLRESAITDIKKSVGENACHVQTISGLLALTLSYLPPMEEDTPTPYKDYFNKALLDYEALRAIAYGMASPLEV